MSVNVNNTLTLSDAALLNKPLSFNIMMKPIGSNCNLSCSYCYYLDKGKRYEGAQKMSMELLEKCIKTFIETNETDVITFDWHGGEPLLLGIDFYKKAIEIQNKYKSNKSIFNTLQTNATLIDDEFASFFKDNNFLIGVSIDGPMSIHDTYRKDKNDNPTFMRVLEGIELLHRYSVDFNTMTTINKASEGKGADVYLFLKQLGSHYMQFMPVYEYVNKNTKTITHPDDHDSVLSPHSVNPIAYGQFMCDIFDIWFANDIGDYYVTLFDAILANYCNIQAGICAYSELCANNIVVEHNGDVYPCDHFVYPHYKIGNINESSLYDIVKSDKSIKFLFDKRNTLPKHCFRCEMYNLCYGGCPKHRFSSVGGDTQRLYSLCDGMRLFNNHVKSRMIYLKNSIFL